METNLSKAEALKKISELEQYIKNLDSLESKEVEMENLFLELMNQGLTLEIDNGIINYIYKKNNWIVCIKLKNQEVWFHYGRFWSKFESKFDLNYQQIKEFLDAMVEKHLNSKGFTTLHLRW